MYTMPRPPEIDFQNLTPEGGLSEPNYKIVMEYIERLVEDAIASKESDKEERPIFNVLKNFMELLPKEDEESMTDFNITYYFGQIREKYMGNLALFMDVTDEGTPEFKSMPLNSRELIAYTEGMNFPIRSYLGVSSNAQLALEEKFERVELRSAFDLDIEIVRVEIATRKLEEVIKLENVSLGYDSFFPNKVILPL